MLVVDATDCVYGGRDDMGPGKAAVLGPKTGSACSAVVFVLQLVK